jgi:signal transduction histidine kinase
VFELFLADLSAFFLSLPVMDSEATWVGALTRLVAFCDSTWAVLCESVGGADPLRLCSLYAANEDSELRSALLAEPWARWERGLRGYDTRWPSAQWLSAPWLLPLDRTQPWGGGESDLVRRCDCGAVLGIPLRGEGQSLGALFLGFPSTYAPSLDLSPVRLALIGDLFAQVLVRWRAVRRIQSLQLDTELYTRELRTLTITGQVLISTLDLDTVLDTVVAEIRVALRAESAWVMLPDDADLVWRAAAGPHVRRLIGRRVPLSEGICGWVMREGESVLINDADDDPRLYGEIDASIGTTTVSLLAVPLMYRGVPRGVLEVVNKARGSFDEHDLRLMEEIAVPASIAIENARLFGAIDQALIRREIAEMQVRDLNRDLERRTVELAALNEAGQRIAATLDLESVLQAALEAVADLLGARIAVILLRVPTLEGDGDELLLAAAHPRAAAQVGARFPLGDGHCERRLVTGPLGMAVPLVYQGFVEGIVEVAGNGLGTFDEHDREILEVVANMAAAAIKNAQLYKHLESALEAEQKARAQLVQAGKLSIVGRMVASIAHELNNPLQTMRNSLYLAREGLPLEAPRHRFLEIAIEEIYRLSRLVDQLRDVYRPGLVDQFQSVDLVELIEGVATLLTPHFAESRVLWQFARPSQPVLVNGLADQLRQVFLNLCLNACDAMVEAGGSLTVKFHESPEVRQVGLSFADTGKGIAPHDLPYLFEPFFTTKEAGMGLGLPICYDIVQRHGGWLDVTSELGRGATFIVWLQLAKPHSV